MTISLRLSFLSDFATEETGRVKATGYLLDDDKNEIIKGHVLYVQMDPLKANIYDAKSSDPSTPVVEEEDGYPLQPDSDGSFEFSFGYHDKIIFRPLFSSSPAIDGDTDGVPDLITIGSATDMKASYTPLVFPQEEEGTINLSERLPYVQCDLPKDIIDKFGAKKPQISVIVNDQYAVAKYYEEAIDEGIRIKSSMINDGYVNKFNYLIQYDGHCFASSISRVVVNNYIPRHPSGDTTYRTLPQRPYLKNHVNSILSANDFSVFIDNSDDAAKFVEGDNFTVEIFINAYHYDTFTPRPGYIFTSYTVKRNESQVTIPFRGTDFEGYGSNSEGEAGQLEIDYTWTKAGAKDPSGKPKKPWFNGIINTVG